MEARHHHDDDEEAELLELIGELEHQDPTTVTQVLMQTVTATAAGVNTTITKTAAATAANADA